MRRIVLMDDLSHQERDGLQDAPAPWEGHETSYSRLHPQEITTISRRIKLKGNARDAFRLAFTSPYLNPSEIATCLGVRPQTATSYLDMADKRIKGADWGRWVGLLTQCILRFGWRDTQDVMRGRYRKV